MQRLKKLVLTIVIAATVSLPALAQETKTWTLKDCLDYAIENNIDLRQTRNSYLSGIEDTKEAEAAVFPTLSGSVSQGVTNYPSSNVKDNTVYTGRYGIDANMTLYNGGKLRRAIQQQRLQNDMDSLSIKESEINLKISIVQAFMQCLYAKEAISVNESTAEGSKAQMDRAYEMWKTGSISKVDYSQLESQYYSDLYGVTTARTAYDNYKLQLKQLLELDINDTLELSEPLIDEAEILSLIPSKNDVYAKALEVMPEIERSSLSVKSSDLEIKQASAGFLPSVSLSAGVGSGNASGTGNSFSSQIWDNFNENAGLSISIPILSGRKNKTAVSKAKIAASNARLEEIDTRKQLLKEIEGTWLDAVSAQSQYIAAKENENYASQSYDLTSEQFRLGMKNTVELITAKNDLLSAKQSELQAKYTALLNKKILDIYQGNEVE